MTSLQTLNRRLHLFRVPSKRFRVDAIRNQKCSEFEGIFDLPGRLFVQSSGAIGSASWHAMLKNSRKEIGPFLDHTLYARTIRS